MSQIHFNQRLPQKGCCTPPATGGLKCKHLIIIKTEEHTVGTYTCFLHVTDCQCLVFSVIGFVQTPKGELPHALYTSNVIHKSKGVSHLVFNYQVAA